MLLGKPDHGARRFSTDLRGKPRIPDDLETIVIKNLKSFTSRTLPSHTASLREIACRDTILRELVLGQLNL